MQLRKFKLIFLSLLCIITIVYLLISGCGETPPDAPPMLAGSIHITAQIDTTLVDSIEVMVDAEYLGWFANPCLVTDLAVGNHQIAVTKKDPVSPIDFNSIPKLVAVKANHTSDVTLVLSKFAPYFTLKNLKNEDISLESYQGKVVLLVFYSHT